VIDCIVTMTDCGYRVGGSTAADFRKVTPLVVLQALQRAGSQVCEPMAHVRLELPSDSLSGVLPLLARLGARVETPMSDGDLSAIEAQLASARVHELQRALPGLTGGEAVLESRLAGYEPVNGPPPRRGRLRPNPLNREEYVMHLARRV
jgi:ribosomal protection tetracycline resistance protein